VERGSQISVGELFLLMGRSFKSNPVLQLHYTWRKKALPEPDKEPILRNSISAEKFLYAFFLSSDYVEIKFRNKKVDTILSFSGNKIEYFYICI
jgi:hypothetical protein